MHFLKHWQDKHHYINSYLRWTVWKEVAFTLSTYYFLLSKLIFFSLAYFGNCNQSIGG